MTDEAPEQESKTESPSSKRLEDAHKHGDVAKSQEVVTWFMLGGSAAVFALLAGPLSQNLVSQLRILIANADQYEVGGAALGSFFWSLASSILLTALLPLGVLLVCAVAANLLQHRPLMSLDPLKPKLSKISPLAGAKRLFSIEALVNFAKGLIKLGVVGGVMFYVLWPEQDRLSTMMTTDPVVILETFQDLALKLFWATLVVVTFIALADYLYQRQRWWNRQKMTVQEVRDEYKQMEGDPKIKSRIRQIRMERSRHRMMAAVPTATVVVTNPTHYAVALKYDASMQAPVCVAKGADGVALRIRALAGEHDVPIVENPPLARALYASVDLDKTIPTEHFKAVAQVIGYVMRLKDKRGWKSARPNSAPRN
ncbi:MAG TPA: flagellar biosynthesis protein FlhB [Devosiaceae bacterium]|jgi:flagellar biosynthetic protein FlhB